PSIGHQLGVPSTSIDAVVVAYLLSLAVVIPASGWLGDRWGTRRVFLVALALFTITSALCGLASNFTMLVFFRFLQGAAGGALAPRSEEHTSELQSRENLVCRLLLEKKKKKKKQIYDN